MEHKYSTYFLILLLGIFFIALVSGIDLDEWSENCPNGTIPYLYAGELVCGYLPEPTVYNGSVIIYNGTLLEYINLTGTATANNFRYSETGNGPANAFMSPVGGGNGWWQHWYSGGTQWLVYSTDGTEDNGNDFNIPLNPSDGFYIGYGRGATDPIYIGDNQNEFIQGDGYMAIASMNVTEGDLNVLTGNISVQECTLIGEASICWNGTNLIIEG